MVPIVGSHKLLLRWTPNVISDAIWCAGGTFIVGAGHQVFCFGTPSLAVGYDRPDLVTKNDNHSVPEKPMLFERVAHVNGPLPDYHPQILLQCLLWGQCNVPYDRNQGSHCLRP